MPGYYVLQKNPAAKQHYHFVLKADNHETILTSENYSTKQGAHTGIASCQKNSPYDSSYERRKSVSDQPYFVLKAANHEVIGVSQMYGSTSARDSGIESCKKNGPTTDVRDMT
jgi:uncharacterized protein YegP (UPF0339 family)